MPIKPANGCARASGFTLIEILITLLVLSVGLLGLAMLQTRTIQATHSAYLRSQASWLAYDILERMRANLPAAQAGAYVTNYGVTYPLTDCLTVTCSTAQMTAFDLYQWKSDLAARLSAGDGAVALNTVNATTQIFTISVRWDDKRTGLAASFVTFTLVSQL
ncbi:MAG: type IV pilus modification protein PilV [Magnetococcales bacterium]|nr:type IV pilus modification protein PilV [Magnetococcales bacterium]